MLYDEYHDILRMCSENGLPNAAIVGGGVYEGVTRISESAINQIYGLHRLFQGVVPR